MEKNLKDFIIFYLSIFAFAGVLILVEWLG